MKVIFLFVIIFMLSCCSQKERNSTNVQEIAIDKALAKKNKVAVSDFIQGDIKYIQLESNKECQLGEFIQMYTNDSLIIAIAFRQIYLFDKNTGKFIREIGHVGRDPGSYRSTVYTFPYDETQNTFYARGLGTSYFNEYDEKGNLNKKIKTPNNTQSLAVLNDNTYVAYIGNYIGNEKTKLVIYNTDGTIIKEYPNFRTYEPTTRVAVWRSSYFYKFNTNLYFFEQFTDTIFQVTENELFPKYVLKLGEYAPPYEMQNSEKFVSENYYFTENIFEGQRYLFFIINYKNQKYCGMHDKKNKDTEITVNTEGFKNDIDNFIPFQYYSVNNNGELVGFQEAYKIVEWFNNYPEKIENLPPYLKKLKNIKETDNPVVMIAKLKE